MTYRFSLLSSLSLCALLITVTGCATNNTASQAPATSATNVLTPKGSTNFSAKEANFAIYFPGKVTQSQTAGTSQWGNYQTFTYACRTASASYVVIATTIPSGVDTSDSVGFLDGLQKGLLKGSRATVDKSRAVSLNKTPGRELSTTMKVGANTGKSRALLFVTPTITYQVMAIGLDGELQSQKTQIEKVLYSFRLLTP